MECYKTMNRVIAACSTRLKQVYVTGEQVHTTRLVMIGDDVWTGPYVYITDQNHGYEDLATPIGRQFPVNRPVRVGSGSWLGAGAIVLPGRHRPQRGGGGRLAVASGLGGSTGLPRRSWTGNLRLNHAATCLFRSSSMTSCGVR